MTDTPEFGSRRVFYSFEPELLNAELPEFDLVREVGTGSMGVVYEARRRGSGRRVAIKVLPPSLTLTERQLARFLREGQLLARIHHPSIVSVHEQGRSGRLHWFVMDFVDGQTLEQRLQLGPLPLRQACAIAAQIAHALQYAHDHGIVHRDVKPSNLLLREDSEHHDGVPQVAITDFGLARETGSGSMTDSGAIVGTPMYMPPEQVLGGTVQAGTLGDVYSLGATLYTMVTGRPPFDGPTAQAVLKAVLDRDPVPPQKRRADLPAELGAIIDHAMQKRPGDRYGSAVEFAEDLERFLAGQRTVARPRRTVHLLGRSLRRRPLTWSLAALLLTALAGAVWFGLDARERSRTALYLAAESKFARACTSRNEDDVARTAQEREELLLEALASTTQLARLEPGEPQVWLLRAKVHLRLDDPAATVHDCDQLERHLGRVTPEALRLRIEALRRLADGPSVQRLQRDLAQLLQLDPGPLSQTMVADHLIEVAELAPYHERGEVLKTIADMLEQLPDSAHVMVVRARMLELYNFPEEACAEMTQALERHQGDFYVHMQAAAMFERQGFVVDGRVQRDATDLLSGEGGADQLPPLVEMKGISGFLIEVNRLLESIGDRPTVKR